MENTAIPEPTIRVSTAVDANGRNRVVLSIDAGDDRRKSDIKLRPHDATRLAGEMARTAFDMYTSPSEAALTTDEFVTMAKLLRRFAISDMDQWELFSLSTAYGPMYVGISWEVPNPEHYSNLDAMIAAFDSVDGNLT